LTRIAHAGVAATVAAVRRSVAGFRRTASFGMTTWPIWKVGKVRSGSLADIGWPISDVRFAIKSGHGRWRVCKPNCKPTAQHRTALGMPGRDYRLRNSKQENTLSR